jgi:hypothetical protein
MAASPTSPPLSWDPPTPRFISSISPDAPLAAQALQELAASLHARLDGAASISLVLDWFGWNVGWQVSAKKEEEEPVLEYELPDQAAFDLRNATALPAIGAWFRASLIVTAEKEVTTDFDYTVRPVFKDIVITPTDIADELHVWPRSTKNCPVWLQEEMHTFGVVN